MGKTKLLTIILIVLLMVSFSISAKNGCLDFLSKDDSGSSSLAMLFGLKATLISTNRIDLDWGYSGPLITGFKIERSADGVDFTQIGILSAQSPDFAYSDTTVTTATMTYYYRIRAYNKTGDTDFDTLRVSLNGGLLSSFGSNGVVTSNPGPSYDSAYHIAIDSQYMYVAGTERPGGEPPDVGRIEKRNLSDGAFDTSFGTGGVITGITGIPTIVITSTSMYVGSVNQIERRNLSDGSFDTGFGTDGVVSGCGAIAVDSLFMYVATYDGQWRIEKRNLSDGTLVSNFGTGGVVTNTVTTDSPKKITVDSTYMYIIGDVINSGYSDYQWLIEKRNLSDGSLVTGFGTGGVVISNPSSYEDKVTTIAIDFAYMYVAGFDTGISDVGSFNRRWRIEKRNLSDGTLVSGFGTGGVVITNPSNYEDEVTTMAIDSTYMYVGGYESYNSGSANSIPWRIEKRNLSDGNLVTDFGTGGIITSNTVELRSITIDSNYIYAVGHAFNQWRIEKRLK